MADKNNDLPILIIGAGIAGLTLAQALRLRSIPFRLFERNTESYNVQGHRFRITGECVVALVPVLLPLCKELFLRTGPDRTPWEPRYVDAQSLSFPPKIAARELGSSKPVDRSWFRMILTHGVEDAIEYGKELSSYEVDDTGTVHVHFLDNSSAHGNLLVGADGIKSRVRSQLQPDRRLLDLERWIMWGRTPLTDKLQARLPEDIFTWFMAADKENNSQLIVEPMTWDRDTRDASQGRLPMFESYIYWALSCSQDSATELPRSIDEKRALLQKVTKTWNKSLQLLLDSAFHEWSACAPALSSKPVIEMKLAKPPDKVTIIGDAAHAMSPMGGLGADTAIHSAIDLAMTLSKASSSEKEIGEFEARMAARAKEKILYSFKGGQRYWQGREWTQYKETNF